MKRLRIGIGGLAVLAAAGIGTWWLSRPRLTDREQIANTIIEIKRAVEIKDAGGVLRHIDRDFKGGGYSRQDITQFVVGGFRSPEAFRVEVEAPEITVAGDTAEARLQATFAWGPEGARDQAVPLSIVAQFRRVGGRWKVVGAGGWEPAMEAGR